MSKTKKKILGYILISPFVIAVSAGLIITAHYLFSTKVGFCIAVLVAVVLLASIGVSLLESSDKKEIGV